MYIDAEKMREEYKTLQKTAIEYKHTQKPQVILTDSQFNRFQNEFVIIPATF